MGHWAPLTFSACSLYIFICIRLADHAVWSLLLCVWSAPITELMLARWFYDRGGQRQMLNILSAAQSAKIPPNLPFPPPSIGILHHKNQSTKYHSVTLNRSTRDFLKTRIEISKVLWIAKAIHIMYMEVKTFGQYVLPLVRLVTTDARFWRKLSFSCLVEKVNYFCRVRQGRCGVKGEKEAKQLRTSARHLPFVIVFVFAFVFVFLFVLVKCEIEVKQLRTSAIWYIEHLPFVIEYWLLKDT